MRQRVWSIEVLPESRPTCRTRTPGCTPTPSRPDTRLRHCHWTVSTFRLRMTSPVIITYRESVTRRQVPGTPSTLPGRSTRTASRGQAPPPGRSASPPRSWAARLPPLEEGTTSSPDRTPSAPGGDHMNPSDRLSQERRLALRTSTGWCTPTSNA